MLSRAIAAAFHHVSLGSVLALVAALPGCGSDASSSPDPTGTGGSNQDGAVNDTAAAETGKDGQTDGPSAETGPDSADGQTCNPPKHMCSGQCVNDDPAACGPGCTACPKPDYGTATCSSSQCGFDCDVDHVKCNDKCCAKDLSGITAIAAGTRHTCVLTRDGFVKCWGNNSNGQLGDGNASGTSATPVDVKALWAWSIATGLRHSCALSLGGTVQCWGLGDQGQLGNGVASDSPLPVEVPGIKHARAIAAGEHHTCVLLKNKKVMCWGANASGQFGNGTTDPSMTPVETTTGFKAIAGRYEHTCGIDDNNALSCWGSNVFGEVGNATSSPQPSPVIVDSSVASVAPGDNHTCAALLSGAVHCWGSNVAGQNGTGSAVPSKVPVPIASSSVFSSLLASGGSHSCAVNAGGAIECWGSNVSGQLGLGTTGQKHDTPEPVIGSGSSPTGIAAGGWHTCAIVNGGHVQCWGSNLFSEVGSGASQPAEVPSPTTVVHGGRDLDPPCPGAGERRCGTATCVPDSIQWCGVSCETCEAPTGGIATCVAGECGMQCTVAEEHVCGNACVPEGPASCGDTCNSCPVPTGGEATCTGGVCGMQCTQPGDHVCGSACVPEGPSSCGATCDVCSAPANGVATCSQGACGLQCSAGYTPCTSGCCGVLSGVAEVAAGGDHACARLGNGTVLCWGNNISGQLGDGTAGGSASKPVVVSGVSGPTGLAMGMNHSCALASGAAWCWGMGSGGQLGNGGSTDSPTPVAVSGLSTASSMAAGLWHTCAIVGTGERCWGSNANGQLGDGTASSHSIPTPVVGLSGNVPSISAGMYHSCAVAGGQVYCWGENQNGQLGVDPASKPKSSTPLAVAGLTSMMKVGPGADAVHACALSSSGAVKCWGRGDSGQLGDGSMSATVFAPVDVTGLSSGVTSIALGRDRSCALMSSGAVKCWGWNGLGQLGDGTQDTTGTPVDVVGLTGVTAITSGWGWSCGLMTDTTVRCWGENAKGQLGDGTTTLRTTPVPVLAP